MSHWIGLQKHRSHRSQDSTVTLIGNQVEDCSSWSVSKRNIRTLRLERGPWPSPIPEAGSAWLFPSPSYYSVQEVKLFILPKSPFRNWTGAVCSAIMLVSKCALVPKKTDIRQWYWYIWEDYWCIRELDWGYGSVENSCLTCPRPWIQSTATKQNKKPWY